MGLLRRKKDKGITDLGDGNVLVSPERIEEMADQTVQRVLERYEDSIPSGANAAIEIAVNRRHGSELGGKLEGLLLGLARMGYGSRQFEDEMESVEAAVPWMTEEIERRVSEGEDDPALSFADIAVELCDNWGGDPTASRSVDAVQTFFGPMRDKVRLKLVNAAATVASNQGMCEPGDLPEGVDGEEMFAVWHIGFLVRALEKSLPEQWSDPDITLIVVDAEAAKEAAYEWADAHPGFTQEESDEATKRAMLDPRFRIDVNDERVGVDPRFIMFELDGNGEIIPQDDLQPSRPTEDEG